MVIKVLRQNIASGSLNIYFLGIKTYLWPSKKSCTTISFI